MKGSRHGTTGIVASWSRNGKDLGRIWNTPGMVVFFPCAFPYVTSVYYGIEVLLLYNGDYHTKLVGLFPYTFHVDGV